MRPYDYHDGGTLGYELSCNDLSNLLQFNMHTCSKRKCKNSKNKNRLFSLDLNNEEDSTFLMKVYITKKYGPSECDRPSTRSLVKEAYEFYNQKKTVLVCQSFLQTLKAKTSFICSDMCIIAPQGSSLGATPSLVTTPTTNCMNSIPSTTSRFKEDAFLEKIKQSSNVMWKKKISKMSNGRKLNTRLDDGLAYLVRLAGFNSVKEMKENRLVFNEVMYLMNLLKIRLMSRTELVDIDPDVSDEDHDEGVVEDDLHQQSSENVCVGNSQDQLQCLLSENLSRKDYTEAKNLLISTSVGQTNLQSMYMINKPIKEIIVPFSFVNSEYLKLHEGNADPSYIDLNSMSGEAISSIVAARTNQPILESRTLASDEYQSTAIPQFCVGAYIPIEECVSIFAKKIKKVIACLPGFTMSDVLRDAFFVGCIDGAVHEKVSESNKNIMSYSITLTSRFLIEKLAIYPTSPNWILRLII